MSPKCATRSSVIACLALLGLACGQKPGQATTKDSQENKTPSSTTAPVEPPAPPASAGGVLDQIPSSSFLVMHFSQLEKSAGVVKSLLEKTGGVLDSEEVKQGLEKLRAETGIDPFDPEVLKKLGIDSSKGITFAADSEFIYKSALKMDWAAMAKLDRKPAVYAVLSLSDPGTFYTWIKETLPKKASSTFRFEDDLVGELKVVYVYETPKASGALTPEEGVKEASVFGAAEETVFTDQIVAEPPPAEGLVAKRVAPRPAPKPVPPEREAPPAGVRAPVKLPEPLPPAPLPPPAVMTEELRAALVNKGELVYIFLPDDLSKPSIPEIPDVVATFKDDLRDFFAKESTPVTKEASFQAAIKKVDPKKNFFFFLDSNKTFALVSKTREPELIFLAPKDEAQRVSQENEKKWRKESAAVAAEEEAIAKALVAAVPAFALSANLDETKAELTGLALVGSAYQTQLQKVLVPSAKAPAYGTLFPESTTFFYRYSLNFLALKDMIFSLLPTDVRKSAEEGWQKVNAVTLAMAGLDLDKDILGAFTGHVATGIPSMESFLMPFFLLFEPTGGPPAPPQLPEMLAVMQLTTPDAGDKLLTAVEKLLTAQARIPVKTEEADGNKIYSVTVEGISFAWGRAEDLLFFGNNAQILKDAFGRQKSPGASFTDKLGGERAKELVTHAAASGLTLHLGNLFGFLALQPKGDQEEKDVMGKLSKIFGTLTIDSRYEEGGLQFYGELTLQ